MKWKLIEINKIIDVEPDSAGNYNFQQAFQESGINNLKDIAPEQKIGSESNFTALLGDGKTITAVSLKVIDSFDKWWMLNGIPEISYKFVHNYTTTPDDPTLGTYTLYYVPPVIPPELFNRGNVEIIFIKDPYGFGITLDAQIKLAQTMIDIVESNA